jgi:hypothetical protein
VCQRPEFSFVRRDPTAMWICGRTFDKLAEEKERITTVLMFKSIPF